MEDQTCSTPRNGRWRPDRKRLNFALRYIFMFFHLCDLFRRIYCWSSQILMSTDDKWSRSRIIVNIINWGDHRFGFGTIEVIATDSDFGTSFANLELGPNKPWQESVFQGVIWQIHWLMEVWHKIAFRWRKVDFQGTDFGFTQRTLT